MVDNCESIGSKYIDTNEINDQNGATNLNNIPRNVIVDVNGNIISGNVIVDANGNIISGNVILDANGNIISGNVILDANGNAITNLNNIPGNVIVDINGNIIPSTIIRTDDVRLPGNFSISFNGNVNPPPNRTIATEIPENLPIDNEGNVIPSSQSFENSPFYAELTPIIENFENNITAIPQEQFGDRELLTKNTKELNTFLRNEINRLANESRALKLSSGVQTTAPGATTNNFLSNGVQTTAPGATTNNFLLDLEEIKDVYPSIYSRLILTPFLTPIEISGYIQNSFFNANTFTNLLKPFNKKILNLLESFLSAYMFSQRTMGAFCALVPSIFATIREFAAFFDNIVAVAGKIIDFINSPGGSLIESLINLIEKTIDNIINDIKERISNFISAFIDSVTGVLRRLTEKIIAIKNRIEQLFSKENIEALKEKVKGTVAYAVGVFENPTIDEIDYMVNRFCAFISEIEKSLLNSLQPIYDFTTNYQTAYRNLQSVSQINTARAIQIGATRYSNVQRTQVIEEATQQTAEVVRYPTPTPPEVAIPWNDGNGVPGKVVFPAKLSGMGQRGWEGISPRVNLFLSLCQVNFNKELRINSAFRDAAYNARVGGVPNSMHVSGEALDVSFDGISDSNTRNNFLFSAFKAGFEWYKYYPSQNFIHIDTKRRNSNSDLSKIFG
jgi:hypothetical protein